MMRRDRHRAQCAAQRQTSGVAHEHRRGGRVEPQEGEPRADDCEQQYGQIASAEDMRNAEIFGEFGVTHEVGDQHERDRRDDHRHRCQTVEPVG